VPHLSDITGAGATGRDSDLCYRQDSMHDWISLTARQVIGTAQPMTCRGNGMDWFSNGLEVSKGCPSRERSIWELERPASFGGPRFACITWHLSQGSFRCLLTPDLYFCHVFRILFGGVSSMLTTSFFRDSVTLASCDKYTTGYDKYTEYCKKIIVAMLPDFAAAQTGAAARLRAGLPRHSCFINDYGE